MQERLTLVRPTGLGRTLAAAVRAVCTPAPQLTPGAVPALTARLACGDFESVRELLRNAPAAPALPLTLARYVRWTGDLDTAAAAWTAVLSAMDSSLDAAPELRHATYAELPATATDLGAAALAARLHALARTTSDDSEPRALSDQNVHLVCSIVFDVLGLEPDATRGRIRLRPQLHRHDTLEARSIRFGDGSISMSAEHTDGTVVIRIAQDAGSIPVTALLEPIVDIFASAEVDGRAADLVPRTVADGVIVPVQLVLDGARTVVIRTE